MSDDRKPSSRIPETRRLRACREDDKAPKDGEREEAIAKLTQDLEKLGVTVEMEKR